MRSIITPVFFACSLLAASSAAQAPPPAEPSTGTALLAVGGVSLSLGIVALAAVSPVCATEVQGRHLDFIVGNYVSGSRTSCLDGAIGAGIGLVVLGLPLVIVGAVKRSGWNHWHDQGPTVAPVAGGAVLGWRFAF